MVDFDKTPAGAVDQRKAARLNAARGYTSKVTSPRQADTSWTFVPEMMEQLCLGNFNREPSGCPHRNIEGNDLSIVNHVLGQETISKSVVALVNLVSPTSVAQRVCEDF
jgi:hypothetical protein